MFAASQDRVDADLQETPTPGYGVMSLRVGGQVKNFRVTLDLDSVFNKLYVNYNSFQRDPYTAPAFAFASRGAISTRASRTGSDSKIPAFPRRLTPTSVGRMNRRVVKHDNATPAVGIVRMDRPAPIRSPWVPRRVGALHHAEPHV